MVHYEDTEEKKNIFQYTWRESSDYKTSILKSVRRFVVNVILVEKRNCSVTKCKNIYSFEGNRIELRHANTTALRYSPSLNPYDINLTPNHGASSSIHYGRKTKQEKSAMAVRQLIIMQEVGYITPSSP